MKHNIIENITKTVIKKINEEITSNRDTHRSTYYTTLLDCPRFVHAYHLEMKKHSYHVELDELYKELPELVDILIENEQGNYGLVKGLRSLEFNRNYDMSDGNPDPIKYLEELKKFIMVGRKVIYDPEKDSAFYSDIDNLISTIDGTLYKLKHLP